MSVQSVMTPVPAASLTLNWNAVASPPVVATIQVNGTVVEVGVPAIKAVGASGSSAAVVASAVAASPSPTVFWARIAKV